MRDLQRELHLAGSDWAMMGKQELVPQLSQLLLVLQEAGEGESSEQMSCDYCGKEGGLGKKKEQLLCGVHGEEQQGRDLHGERGSLGKKLWPLCPHSGQQ